MVQMAPNKSFITATVLSVEPYAAQQGFLILQLQVISSKKTEQLQMPGAEKGATLKAITTAADVEQLKIVAGSKVECELKKVSTELWRVIVLKVKNQKSK
ncbi:MAG: hypothetical protein QM725_09675 [Lacibacter sp.]